MSEPVASGPKFRVFSVLGQSFAILFRNIVPFGIFSIIFSSPGFIFFQVAGPMVYFREPYIPLVVGSISSFLAMTVLVSGVFECLTGRTGEIYRSLFRGIWKAFRALGIVILVSIGSILFGALILVLELDISAGYLFEIPTAVFVVIAILMPVLAILFWVILPVAVLERRFMSSFRRSVTLSKGNRLRIVAIAILLIYFSRIFRSIVQMGAEELATQFASYTAIPVIGWIVSAFLSALSAVVVTVSYYRLRAVRDGPDEHDITAEFD